MPALRVPSVRPGSVLIYDSQVFLNSEQLLSSCVHFPYFPFSFLNYCLESIRVGYNHHPMDVHRNRSPFYVMRRGMAEYAEMGDDMYFQADGRAQHGLSVPYDPNVKCLFDQLPYPPLTQQDWEFLDANYAACSLSTLAECQNFYLFVRQFCQERWQS